MLYEWSGRRSDLPRVVTGAMFNGLHPEAMFVYHDDPSTIHFLSDDGDRKIDGSKCKDANTDKMKFRAIQLGIQ